MTDWAAIVLAGGRGSRLGGRDKGALEFEGMSLVETARSAVDGAGAVVVVGAGVPPAGALAVCEVPRWAGPAAALAAGLDVVPSGVARVAVLAVDLPRARQAIARVLAAPPAADGCIAVDDAGIRQPLLAVYRAEALRRAVEEARARGPLTGLSLRVLLAGLDLAEVLLPAELTADVDSPDDAARAGIELGEGPR